MHRKVNMSHIRRTGAIQCFLVFMSTLRNCGSTTCPIWALVQAQVFMVKIFERARVKVFITRKASETVVS
jgi:hypothetical protein